MNVERVKIVKSGFSSVLQIIASSFCYVVIYFLVIFKLGKEQLGIWAIITAIPAAVSFLGTGVSGSILRHIPIYAAKKQKEQITKIIFNGFLFNLVLGLVIVTSAFLLSTPLLKFMFGIKVVPMFYQQLFYYTLLTFLVSFISSVSLAALDGLQKIFEKNLILIVSSLLFCVMAIVMIFTLNLKGLFYAQFLQASIILILSLLIIYRSKLFDLSYARVDSSSLRLFYIYGRNLQYISVLNILFEPITKFFLNRYFGLGTVGVYDLVNRIVSQLRMLIVSAVQVIVPFVAKEIDENNAAVQHLYEKSFKGTLLLSAILFGLLLTGGFSFLYLSKNIPISEFQIILLYLAIANVINILSAPAYAIRLATGKFKYLIGSQLLSTTLNIILFLCLGQYPSSKFMLLPTSTAIGLSSLYIIMSYRRTLNININWTKNDLSIGFASVLFPIFCIIISTTWMNLALLLALAFTHLIIVGFLIFGNDYLMNVIHILVRKKGKA